MDGPPGTGKSQTIANMIGVLLHAGKTVLFVSEKAAALDVVRDRLAAAGLRAYLLELHSHKATRKQVAEELGGALDTVPVPPAAMTAMDVDTVRKRREAAQRLCRCHEPPRNPLGYRCMRCWADRRLQDVPVAPVDRHGAADLTVEASARSRGARNAWRCVAAGPAGPTFVWRGVTERGSMVASVPGRHRPGTR